MFVSGVITMYMEHKEDVRQKKESMEISKKYIEQFSMQGDSEKNLEYVEYQNPVTNRRYRIMHDHWKFYRAFSFAPTTDEAAIWQPVPELPWQLSFDAAQEDLNTLARGKQWEKVETRRFAPEDISPVCD